MMCLKIVLRRTPLVNFLAILLIQLFSAWYGTGKLYAATGELYASMYAVPVLRSTGLGETNIQWTSTGTTDTQVWVSQGSAPRRQMASAGVSGSSFVPWIQNGITYTFYLYQASGYLPSDTIAVLDQIVIYGLPSVQPQIGLNRMDLHIQYYGSTSGCENNPSVPCFAVSKRLAKKSIQDAKYIGAGYLRVAVSDYHGDKWLTDSVKFWADMDEMVMDLNTAKIKLVPSLMFNIYQHAQAVNSDMHTLITDPNSNAYKYAVHFITKFVTRYKNNPVICFWELTNEMNLSSDIDAFANSGNDPVYTNFTTAEMSAFNKRMTTLIRSLDKTHMITSGYSMPRPSAYHLVKQPHWINGGNWTLDTEPEFSSYLIESHKYFDIVGIHTYNGDGDNDKLNDNERFGITGLYNAGLVSIVKQLTDANQKLLYIGESSDFLPKSLYDKNCPFTQNVLDQVQSNHIPFSSPWILEFYQFDTYHESEFNIDPIYTTPLITKIMNVNKALGNNPVPSAIPDTTPPICIIAFPFTGNSFAEPRDTVYVKVSDNSLAIDRVELWIDGTYQSSTNTWPFKIPVKTDTLPSCDHRVVARVFDKAGNSSQDIITMYKTGSLCACVKPTTPTLRASSLNICRTQSTTLTIATGTLNSATKWIWYAGSCGEKGIPVGSGTSITVSPKTSTTYYARGEGGECVDGNCASIEISVAPLRTVTLAPFSAVCEFSTPFLLTGGSPKGGTYSGNGVRRGMFNPAIAGVGTHTITYSSKEENSCTITATADIIVKSEIHCLGPRYTERERLFVYPIPNNGNFTINFNTRETFSLFNAIGQIIQTIQLNESNNYLVNVNVTDPGLYILVGHSNAMLNYKIVVVK